MTVEEWIETRFADGSRPTKRTVWRWIRNGHLPATRIGKRYYLRHDAMPVTYTTSCSALVDSVLGC